MQKRNIILYITKQSSCSEIVEKVVVSSGGGLIVATRAVVHGDLGRGGCLVGVDDVALLVCRLDGCLNLYLAIFVRFDNIYVQKVKIFSNKIKRLFFICFEITRFDH